jgi:uncharacterized membrane protein
VARSRAGSSRLSSSLRPLWWVGVVAFLAQLGVLIAYSALLYSRFDLTRDFAVFHQAWLLIAHGTLSPFNSVDGFPFWRNHFELAMWPLALLYWVSPHPFDLLVVQDVALAGAGLVAYRFGLDVATRRMYRTGRGGAPGLPAVPLAVGLLLVLLLDPWLWQAASFDFHFQALAALFTVLSARDLYNGKLWRALLFALLTLLNGDVAGTYVIGLGLTGLVAARATRRAGVAMVVMGAAWVAIISALGANLGSSFASGYAYLVEPGQKVTLWSIGEGLVRHPSRAFHVLDTRWRTILKNLVPVGLIGVLSPYALGVSFVVFLAGVLQSSAGYIAPGYQNVVVYFLVPVGTVMVLDWVAGTRRVRTSSIGAAALGVALLATSLGYGISQLRLIPGSWLLVTPGAVAALDHAASVVPGDAEVVASQGVMGRFGGRRYVYQVVYDVESYPLRAKEVVFVLAAGEGIEQVTPPFARADVAAARRLGASVVASGGGVTVLAWHPPPGAVRVSLPSGAVTYRAPGRG